MIDSTRLVLLTTFFLTSLASPLSSSSSTQTTAQLALKQKQQALSFAKNNICAGQSCIVADASGSSGRQPSMRPEGGDEQDIKCITHYNPSLTTLLAAKDFPTVEKQPTGFHSALMTGFDNLWRPVVNWYGGATDTGVFAGKCTPNIVIFARGTFEPGDVGAFVGPPLLKQLEKDDFSSWSMAGVVYDANVPGDYCLGLPGGMVARDMINQAAKKCPKSDLFLSGYSQGAMVARNGIAYADDEARKHVKGLLTYGDPFQGSPVKSYTGPIATFCAPDDGVCGGNFELAISHLAYGFGADVQAGATALEQMANGTYVAAATGKEVAPASVAQPLVVAAGNGGDGVSPSATGVVAGEVVPAKDGLPAYTLPAVVVVTGSGYGSGSSTPVLAGEVVPAQDGLPAYTLPAVVGSASGAAPPPVAVVAAPQPASVPVVGSPSLAGVATPAYTMPSRPSPSSGGGGGGGPDECEKCSR